MARVCLSILLSIISKQIGSNNMKAFLKTLLAIIVTISAYQLAANERNVIFKAGDTSRDTQTCIAAAQDDLFKLKAWGRFNGNGPKSTTRDLICNDQDITNFAASYGAYKTTKYLSRYAPKKYKVDVDKVRIIDLANNKTPTNKAEIILVTSN